MRDRDGERARRARAAERGRRRAVTSPEGASDCSISPVEEPDMPTAESGRSRGRGGRRCRSTREYALRRTTRLVQSAARPTGHVRHSRWARRHRERRRDRERHRRDQRRQDHRGRRERRRSRRCARHRRHRTDRLSRHDGRRDERSASRRSARAPWRRSTSRRSGRFNPNAQAFFGINPHSAHVGVARVVGITHGRVAPTGGIISGQAALMNLAG